VPGRTGLAGIVVKPTVMTCPHCQTDGTQRLDDATDLGYGCFRCRRCGLRFNGRTGTPFNYLEFPADIVFQVVVFRLLFKLGLRDLARMFLMRGYEFTHETVREWEERFAPLLAEQLRRKRKGKTRSRWYVDEKYLKVKGKWCYLYRAIDREGNLVDSMLSRTRDMAAAQLTAIAADNARATLHHYHVIQTMPSANLDTNDLIQSML
jgi:putative transposase